MGQCSLSCATLYCSLALLLLQSASSRRLSSSKDEPSGFVVDQHEKRMEEILQSLTDDDKAIAGKASLALYDKEGKKYVPRIIAIVRDRLTPHPEYAMWALGRMKDVPIEGVKVLVDVAIKDQDEIVRMYASSALMATGARGAAVLGRFIEESFSRKHESPVGIRYRSEALVALSGMGRGAVGAMPALRGILRAKEGVKPIEFEDAARIVGRLGISGTEALPELKYWLKSDDLRRRRIAIGTLGKMGRAAKALITELRALNNADAETREEAASALKKIDP